MNDIIIILMKLCMGLVVLLFMIVPCIHALHMFQQNRYELFRYNNWLKDKVKEETKKTVLYFIKTLPFIIVLFLPIHPNYLYIAYALLGCLYAFYMIQKERKQHYIKPLVYTSRVKRQIICMIVLNVLWIGSALYFIPSSKWYILFFIIGFIINWFLVYPMAYITSPIEDLVKKYYIGLAKKILKNSNSLIKVGITGSFGKTSSKNIMQEILSEKFYSLMTPASYNTPMGITKTIRNDLKPIHQVFLCEMGADKVGEIDFLTKFVQPQYGIVTSIGPQHLNTFKSLDNIIHEKMRMIENLPANGVGILNKDNEYIRNYKIINSCKIVWYGIEEEDVDYYATNIQYTPSGSEFDVIYENESYHFQTKLLGKHNIANILASIALGRELQVSWADLIHAVRRVNYVEHRLEVKKINGYTFIDNAFNSNPVGSAMSLEVLSMMPSNRYIVTPGMIDLGERQYGANYDFGANMKGKVDFAILVGEKQTKPIVEGLESVGFDSNKYMVVKTVKEAFDYIYSHASKTDTILLENDLPDAFNK